MASTLEQERKKFVSEQVAKGMSRSEALKRFYVQTRVKELTAAGKPVTPEVRARLRQNWDSGNVKRSEFGAPKAGASKTKPTPKPQGPKRTGPESGPYTKTKPTRTGPESGSPTKAPAKPNRMGPESKSYTKAGAPNVTPNMERKKPVKKSTTRTGPETKSYLTKNARKQPIRSGPESTSYTKKKIYQTPASRFADKFFG